MHVPTTMNKILCTLRSCGVCEQCIQITFTACNDQFKSTTISSIEDDTINNDNNGSVSFNTSSCPLCLDLLSKYKECYETKIATKINEKMNPYISHDRANDSEHTFHATTNVISKDSPTIVLPNNILFMAHCINCIIEQTTINQVDEKNDDNTPRTQTKYKVRKPLEVYNEIKEILRSKIRKLLIKINDENNAKFVKSYGQRVDNCQDTFLQILQEEEEAGYLKFHLVITSPLSFPLLPYLKNGILTLPQLSKKRDRKRFRGNDPVAKQGGDPRTNLNSFVKGKILSIQEHFDVFESMGIDKDIVEGNVQCSLIEKNVITKYLETSGSRNEIKKQLMKWFIENAPSACKDIASMIQENKNANQSHIISEVGLFISCWRNHFYLKGKYTKSRRDVSQTPFYVNDDSGPNDSNQKMKRLGISSVEEEICAVISIACHGISNENNEPKKFNSESSKNNLVYGICKFHASGREDMDVRMILPQEAKQFVFEKKKIVASGRPFICEVIDAHKFPSVDDLRKAVKLINQNGNEEGCYDEAAALECVTLASDGKWVNEKERIHVQYGLNVNGVGISGLHYCRSSLFGNLQSETENKVKFYGCLCWSEHLIPSQAYLEEKLMRNQNDGSSIYPLTIEQLTPLRVLHRRSAGSRIRHVLTLNATKIDNHWFRLHLSTSAGTYVKEFCHGDCGRTKPNLSSLLGCRTDIVELDCEGIALS